MTSNFFDPKSPDRLCGTVVAEPVGDAGHQGVVLWRAVLDRILRHCVVDGGDLAQISDDRITIGDGHSLIVSPWHRRAQDLMNETSIDIATRAFGHFIHGWASGDFTSYIAMLADEIDFSFPDGLQRGHYGGREGREKMIAKCRGDAEAGERLTIHPPHHITGSGSTTVFEFIAEGMLSDGYFRGEIAIALDVSDGKISGFREYYGFVW